MAIRIFVSHVWRRQHTYYWGLIRLLDQAKRFRFVDLSVPKLRPFDGPAYEAVRDDILRILRTADVVLVINTPIVTNSSSVRDELQAAEECGIPIIAISPPTRHGATRTSALDVVRRAGKAHWRTDSIVNAIREAVRNRTQRRAVSNADPDAAYEAISDAAKDDTLSQEEAASVRDDDEEAVVAPVTAAQSVMQISGATPTAAGETVKIEGKEAPSPKTPWYRRLWRWGSRT